MGVVSDEADDLSGYRVTFTQGRMVGMWTWEAETPDGDEVGSVFAFIDKANAKKDALRTIERLERNETLDGNALRDSLH